MKKEEAIKKAFEYWASHYGNLIQIDDDNALYAKGYWAFILRSNYPRTDDFRKIIITECENLGEIIVHETGAIVSATPNEVVVKRLKICLGDE